MNIYETDKLLGEYLLFHYGRAEEILPYPAGPKDALEYPARCVWECVDPARVPPEGRALDLGCAVGRSSFELAKICQSVVGIDFSHRFIDAARSLRDTGALDYLRTDEGELVTPLVARIPQGVEPGRVHFEQGDAMNLRADLGRFDVVLLANLIDRLSDPLRCLERLADCVVPGGQLVVTSPYTWLPEFTPRDRWLGGYADSSGSVPTLDGLRRVLEPHFEMRSVRDLPFLIREHARKFQWSVAQASCWIRRNL
jgi:putative 4-mercaptohistidine N1-methyltranferase